MTVHETHTSAGPFDLSGGALCLDFANTWGNQSDRKADRLRDYGRLVAFGLQAGLFGPETGDALSRRAKASPADAGEAFALARTLREAIYRIFSARAGGEDVPADAIDRINDLVGDAMSRRRLERTGRGFGWKWPDADEGDLRWPVWPIVESAAGLLTSPELERVRECDAPDCNWLFVDRSRSGSRRWCSMKSCGNRAKARRHYRRRRSG